MGFTFVGLGADLSFVANGAKAALAAAKSGATAWAESGAKAT
jgi:hypothetical protein